MRAAIYARKSTDEQTESVPTQIENSLACAARHGWETQPELIFTDTASRAEFVRRTGLPRLRAAVAEQRIDVVIMRDDSRLGGDMYRTAMIGQDFADTGVKIWFYATEEPMRFDTVTSRLITIVKGFASEDERAKIASRTRESLERRARHGFVAGGAVYGYSNIRTPEGVRRAIEPEQAEVVREIATSFADGAGLRELAKSLNTRRVPPPRAGVRGTGSWSPSSIREMLLRPLYVGRIEWGRAHKLYRGGTKIRTDEHEHELVTLDAPELAILDMATWEAVQRRFERTRTAPTGARARHLLTGFSRCARCGGPMQVAKARVGYDNVHAYGCGWHRDRGAAVCGNSLRRPVESVNAAVVGWIREHALCEDVVTEAFRLLRLRIEAQAKRADTEGPALEAEARQLRAEVGRLAAAIARTDGSEALAGEVGAREARLRAIDAELRTLRTAPATVDLEHRRMEREARGRLGELGAVLAQNVAEGRRVIESLLAGRLRFSATAERRYRIEGAVSIGGLVAVEGAISTDGVPSGDRTVLIDALPPILLDLVA
jgi:DNA invertase Pin-like site-specific DNA recombinase